MTPKVALTLWAPLAWLPGGWARQVLLAVGTDGCWSRIAPDVAAVPPDAQRLAGPLLPGLVDAHSHAFQRAFAGLAERRESAVAGADFWSWRDRMYQVAQRITPEALRAVTAQLGVELLLGGYTQLVEFHYLQHAPDGGTYADPLELARAIADGAQQAGIGLTLLPVLYQRAGFDAPTLRDEQRRFARDADAVWQQAQALAASGGPLLDAGIAIHSLRAADAASIHRLRKLADGWDGAIHIHVAEQTAEVDACLAATGARPIEWLARERLLDARWQLVHATHAEPQEIDAVAASGAGVVLCPSTEANLGDGLCDLPRWLDAGVPLSIGSDSHVTRDALEELRWLEYGQRLALRRRQIAAAPQSGCPSTAQRLFQRVLEGGAAACGRRASGLRVGTRADALVVDLDAAPLLGVPDADLLDALVFSSPSRPWRDVLVAGRWVVREHHHPAAAEIATRCADAIAGLGRGPCSA